MAETAAPASAGATETSMTDLQWQALLQAAFPDGVVKNGEGTDLAVTAPGGAMSVNIGIGRMVIRGQIYRNDASLAKTIAAADPSLPRIDRIVIHADLSAHSVASLVLAGTPNASPVAPALTQTSTVWELSLATIAVGAAVTQIVAGNVTDTRPYGGFDAFRLPAATAGTKIYVQQNQPTDLTKYTIWVKTPFA